MNCPYCGEILNDDAVVCSVCGADLSNVPQQGQSAQQSYYAPQQGQSAQQNYYAPQQGQSAQQSYYAPQQPYGAPRRVQQPVTKKEFVKTNEAAAHKAMLVLVTMLISVALIVAGVVGTMTMPFYEIPLMQLVMAEADLDISELEEGFEELEDDYESQKDEMPEEEQEAAEMMLEGMEDLVDDFSIVNVYGFMNVMDEVVEILEDVETMDDVSEIADIMDEVSQAMNLAVAVIVACFVLPLLLTVLAGLCKNTGLTIVAVIFTAIPQLIFCGALWVVAGLAVAIFQAVLCSGISREYRAYRMGSPVM